MNRLKMAFIRAGRWIKRCARPLEVARWEYLFEGGSRERVLEILGAYQNEDGGFGHGLEPDFWLPSSSPMATWAAVRILSEVDVEPENPMVQSLVGYLFHSQDGSGMWPAVLPENNEYPHAPWWHWEPGVEQQWMFNPGVELAAYLIHWSRPDNDNAQKGWKTVQLAIVRLMDCDEMDMHEISNFLAMLELMELREEEFLKNTGYTVSVAKDKLAELVNKAVETDPSEWGNGYKALPLTFVQRPDSFLCNTLGDLVEKNLDFYADQVDDNGLWPVPWQWSAYPSEYAIAARYWQGIIALERYRVLKEFGRL